MDFIEQLPQLEGFTEILVIVYRLTKQIILIPTHRSINAAGLSKLFIQHMFSKHRVPSHVTSDRGSKFIPKFFRSLAASLQMNLHYTSGYHPEADGQTERMNQTLEQYLRTYCNYQQSDWAHLLPLTEFVYNNVLSATTKISPFFANKGYHPQLQIQTNTEWVTESSKPYLAQLEAVHKELKKNIAEAKRRYQGSVDVKCLPAPNIQLGDLVFVLAKFIHTT